MANNLNDLNNLLVHGPGFEAWAMDRKTHYPYDFTKSSEGYVSLFTQAVWTAWLAGKLGNAYWNLDRSLRGKRPYHRRDEVPR